MQISLDLGIRSLGNFIGGIFRPSRGEPFQSTNPSNLDQVIGRFPATPKEEILSAVDQARKCQPSWESESSQPQRAQILMKLARLMEEEEEAQNLALLLVKEAGKPLLESRNEVREAVAFLYHVAGQAYSGSGAIFPSRDPAFEQEELEVPKGVIACIAPWNAPLLIPVIQAAPALLKGNSVILKPSQETPMVGYELARIARESGFPPGVFNLIFGKQQSGWDLVNAPVDGILFTGAFQTGAQILSASEDDPNKSVAVFSGGKNACLVLDDADLEEAVAGVGRSIVAYSGQHCTGCERVIVQEGIYEKFKEGIVEYLSQQRVGDPLDEETVMGPIIRQQNILRIEFYNEMARRESLAVLLDGKRKVDSPCDQGFFISPFLYEMRPGAQFTSRLLNEEVLGPHVALMKVKTIQEAIMVHNATRYTIAAAYFTRSSSHARLLERKLKAGIGVLNAPTHTGELLLPIGGLRSRQGSSLSGDSLFQFVVHRVTRRRKVEREEKRKRQKSRKVSEGVGEHTSNGKTMSHETAGDSEAQPQR